METKKQSVVAHSSVETKFRAMENKASELLWLRQVKEEQEYLINEHIPMHYDNEAINSE